MIRELQDLSGPVLGPANEQGDGTEATIEQDEASAQVDVAKMRRSAEQGTAVPTPAIQNGPAHVNKAPTQTLASNTHTAQKLDDINSALARFGTSLEQVLQLDPKAGDGAGTSAEGVEVGSDGTVSLFRSDVRGEERC